MNEAAEGVAAATAANEGPSPALFSLSDAGFSVQGRDLLHPLTLDLAPGRVIGLVGHNGSGKSTLLKLLGRQQAATTGTISLEGQPLQAWSERPFARRIAYLQQALPPAPGLLVRELVALGRYPWHGALGRFGPDDRRHVEEAMALTGVEAFAGRLVDTLSGGERQRVWLAMLVAQDTRCLLLDEPISALDIAHQIEVLALVRRLARERGTGSIAVLHDINLAARFCDEIIALHGGRLIARGTPDAVLTPDSLKAIYGIEMGVMRHPKGDYPLSFAM